MTRTMPDLCTPRRGFRHDLDSAVATLRRLGVEADRVGVRSAGPGWARGTVLRQSPEPGTELTARTRVTLAVAGAGGVDVLPYPLRDGGDEGFGVDALMALFDNPLLKLALHVRGAGGFLALHPDDDAVTLRWIQEIFGLDLDLRPVGDTPATPLFPRECWYPLARLLPALHQVAGTEAAVRLALGTVFGLPVARVRAVRGIVPLPPEGRTRLGQAASRLGIDTVAGEGVAAPCVLEVTLGRQRTDDPPLTLAQWREHDTPVRRAQRDALYRLAVPAALHRGVREAWAVGDPDAGARPGDPENPPVLGVNARLVAAPAAVPRGAVPEIDIPERSAA
ncbi:MAG TPA: type VI secretion system baseplate subunit TssG [Longimicrobium sp.]|uniref:PASTA domain-containing protein n=1 Tax=Longimicrobium sp. TaxID=2029185 RepID=UPI002EDB7429